MAKKQIDAKGLDKAAAEKLRELVSQLEQLRGSRVFPLVNPFEDISDDLVDRTYELLEDKYKDAVKLDVIVTSGGGDIHPAYHLGTLFRRYARDRLVFIVPRYAKSAATLLVFAGDYILFGPTSELGPLDPQIALPEKGEQGLIQRFSPLAIQPTLDLIAQENDKKHSILVEKLSASLPPALILGQHLKLLEVAKHYVVKLLANRMFKEDQDGDRKAMGIGEALIRNYPDHRWCIDYDEASSLGLRVEMASPEEWKVIWAIYKTFESIVAEAMKKVSPDRAQRAAVMDEVSSILSADTQSSPNKQVEATSQ